MQEKYSNLENAYLQIEMQAEPAPYILKIPIKWQMTSNSSEKSCRPNITTHILSKSLDIVTCSVLKEQFLHLFRELRSHSKVWELA